MISMIVPFNNGEKYLSKCLENLNKIKYEDFEVILINDFSKDNSEEIIKKWLLAADEREICTKNQILSH